MSPEGSKMKRKLYLDMEMGSSDVTLKNVFPDPRIARHNIISIVGFDSYTEIYHCFVYRPDFRKEKHSEHRILTDGKEYKVWIYKSGYEQDILLGFGKLWAKHDYDLIFGWNLTEFDIPYYIKRMENLRVLHKFARKVSHTGIVDQGYERIKIPGCQIFDLMKAAKKTLGRYEDGSLGAVSNRILGVGKLADAVGVVAQWLHDVDLLIDYNIRDVELTVRNDITMPIYDFYEEQMDLTGANVDEILTANYRVCTKYIMFEKAEHPFLDHFFCPNTEGDKVSFGGAITLQPQVGIHHWIAVQDLAIMYPAIMVSCNMSPETVVKRKDFTDEQWELMDPVQVDDVFFRTDFVGFIPKLILKQMALRKSVEKRIEDFAEEHGPGFENTETFKTYMTKRMNIKNLINSWYGIFGYEKFIMYNVDIAKSVTWLGQRQLEWSKRFVKENYDLDTKYGDTDSIFIETPHDIADLVLVDDLVLEMDTIDAILENEIDDEQREVLNARQIEIAALMDAELEKVAAYHDEIGEAITASYDDFSRQYNIQDHMFSMKFEKMYRRIFFSKKKTTGLTGTLAAKKRYAGHIIFKDGKRVDKTDVSGFSTRRSDASKITQKCQNELFRIITRSADPMNEARVLLRKYYLDVRGGTIEPNQAAIPNGFGKKLRAYKRNSRTYHWYAAQWSNQFMGTNFDKGSKPKFIPLRYLPAPYNINPLHHKNKDNWIAFDDDFPLREEFKDVIDWEMVAQKTIIGPTENIAESIGIQLSSIKTGMRKLTMEEAF